MRFIIFEIHKAKFLFMISKILIGIGILMIVASVAPIVWEIYRMTTESAGIGAGIGGVMLIIFTLLGVILLGIGIIKFRRDKNFRKYL